MLKDLLSILKPPLHITFVVLSFLSHIYSLSVCFSLFLTYTDWGWQASKGRKSREPTPTELTFKLHPIPPGTKGRVLNERLNPEICIKNWLSPAFKLVQRDKETSSKHHVLLLPLHLKAWQNMDPASFRFQFYVIRWSVQIYLLYLSVYLYSTSA